MGREDDIRLIAYSIWEKEGCPNGHDCEHWIEAEAIWEKERKSQPVPSIGRAKAKKAPKRARKS